MEQQNKEISDNNQLTCEIEIKPEKDEEFDDNCVIDQYDLFRTSSDGRLENIEDTLTSELSIKYEPEETSNDELINFEPKDSGIGVENRLIFKAGPVSTQKIAVKKLFLFKASVQCGTCGQVTNSWEDWRTHVLHHKSVITVPETQNLEVPRPTRRARMHYCVFCHRDILNFARHMFRKHSNEIEIQRIKSLPPLCQERKKMLSNLRKKGNFLFRSDNPRPVRLSPYKNMDLLPCISCMGFYSAPYLKRHRQKCFRGILGRGTPHKAIAQNFLLKDQKVDPKLREKVFMRMRPDKISMVAKSDLIICECAAEYLRSRNCKIFTARKTSEKMRELAKLLMCARNLEPSIKKMSDLLRTNHYWIIVRAIKIISKKEFDMDNMPVTVRNIIVSLTQCCDMAIKLLNIENPVPSLSDAELQRDIRKLKAYIQFNLKADIIGETANNDDTEKSLLLINNQAGQTVFLHWTAEQKNIVLSHFDTNLKTKVQPKKEECIKLKELYPDLLKTKSWLNIHRFVKNYIFRKKANKNNDDNITKRRVLTQWTREQKKVANSYFKEHINNGIPARKYECVKLIQLHRDLFGNKSWQKIKVYVQNQYVRNRKVTTPSTETQEEPSGVEISEDQSSSMVSDDGRIIGEDLETDHTLSDVEMEPLILSDGTTQQASEFEPTLLEEPMDARLSLEDAIISDLETDHTLSEVEMEPVILSDGTTEKASEFEPTLLEEPTDARLSLDDAIISDLETDLTLSQVEKEPSVILDDCTAEQASEFEPTLLEEPMDTRLSHDDAIISDLEVDSGKTNTSKGPINKKMRFCCLCGIKVKNYARHLIGSHRRQVKVRNFLCTSIYDPKRNILLTKFRRKREQLTKRQKNSVGAGGDNKGTTRNMKKKFILCRNCQGYFRHSLFREHKMQCKELPNYRKRAQQPLNTNKENYVAPSFDAIRKSFDFYDSLEIKDIIQTIRLDESAAVGMGDVLICRYADQVFKKTSGATVRHVVSNTIRELGKILIHLRRMTNYDNLIDTLRPELYDSLFEATKKISGYNSESKTFQYSYLPVKMGKVLKDICKMAIKIIHKGSDIFELEDKDQTIRNLERLMTLIQHHWSSDLLNLESAKSDEPVVLSDSSSSGEEPDGDKLEEPTYDQSLRIPRIKFTEEEKKAIRSFFKKHIQKKQSPKKLEVLEFMSEHTSLFKSKNWVKIKAFVYNEYRSR